MADFKMVVVHLHSPLGTKNVDDTAVGKKVLSIPGAKVAGKHKSAANSEK